MVDSFFFGLISINKCMRYITN